MTELKEIIKSQLRLYETIKAIKAESTKAIQTNTVSLQYCLRKLQSLDEKWSKFERQHDEIYAVATDTEIEADPYFQKDVYDHVRVYVDSVHVDIECAIEQLKAVKPEPITDRAEFVSLIKTQTRLQAKLESALFKAECIVGKEATNSLLIAHLDEISKMFIVFDQNDDRLLEIAEPNDLLSVPYFLEKCSDAVRVMYTTCKALLHEEQSVRFPEVGSHAQAASQSNTTVPRLPPIAIPPFSGDYLSWPTFIDLYDSLVHSNASLDNIQKLHHLKTLVRGPPAELLAPVQSKADNYESAYKMLCDRYQNNRVLVSAQLTTFLAVPLIKSESASSIRHLLDTTQRCLASLANLKIATLNWDPIVVHITVHKLPQTTKQLWDQRIGETTDSPSLAQLYLFLEGRLRLLEETTTNQSASKPYYDLRSSNQPKSHHISNEEYKCIACCSNHLLKDCRQFLQMSEDQRIGLVNDAMLCANCFGDNHRTSDCKSHYSCKQCKCRHHTLLHKNQTSSATQSNLVPPTKDQTKPKRTNPFAVAKPSSQNLSNHIATEDQTKLKPKRTNPFAVAKPSSQNLSNHVATENQTTTQILLATAIVAIQTPDGKHHHVRALLDQGSQCNFICESTVKRLCLSQKPANASISGVDLGNSTEAPCNVRSRVHLNLQTTIKSAFCQLVPAFVLKNITGYLPATRITDQNWPHIQHLPLADIRYQHPDKVELLLGASVYAKIIRQGQRVGPPNSPLAQRTVFGWILSGEVTNRPSNPTEIPRFFNFHNREDTDKILAKFWEVEETSTNKPMSIIEEQCENHFMNTHSRAPDGRFIVSLPFIRDKNGSTGLGKSREIAVNRLYQMERRFRLNPELFKQYSDCLKEYLEEGHMEVAQTQEWEHLIKPKDPQVEPYYTCAYLPHHAVLKQSSTTTKLRVVFDASRKTTSKVSLNDKLLIGPTIQCDMAATLIRWRKHKVAITADVKAMYRQIRVTTEDSDFLRIVWRNTPNLPIIDYKLLTVTFGTSSAPYLAIKVLQQLADNQKEIYPHGTKAILEDFYVDDALTGSDSVESALILQQEIIDCLRSGGFELRKWASNQPELLQNIPSELREMNPVTIRIDESIKTLGIFWHPSTDHWTIKFDMKPTTMFPTKRQFLSEVASFFDPLGLIAPIIVIPKILFQKLWLSKINWDDKLPNEINSDWQKFRNDLTNLPDIQIPRWISYSPTTTHSCQLHGFSDASNHAFAAVVYSRIVDNQGRVFVNLITSKTRVAPIKTLSIPKLELCGALLVSKLLCNVKKALHIDGIKTYCWTDSMIVLGWLQKHPQQLNTFVANRTAQILVNGREAVWRHVSTKKNPADCASRGMKPSELISHQLWWSGPEWLQLRQDQWPQSSLEEIELPEVKPLHVLAAVIDSDVLDRYSTLIRLLRVTAWCRRFLLRVRGTKLTGPIQPTETTSALQNWIRTIQNRHFATEIRKLKSKTAIDSRSTILSLNPFLDSEDILRLGGRLQNSSLPYTQMHPIILPKNDTLTMLIIDKAHIDTLHGGPQLLLAHLRNNYWIPDGRNTIRHRIHRCMTCYRLKSQASQQQMGNLPSARITPNRPFLHSGVDFAGPISLRSTKGRGHKAYKGYICLFVCFSTKAIHLEAVSDLTTDGFLAAFRRFTARRGRISDIYSDNGTNFVGASQVLRKLYKGSCKEVGDEMMRTMTDAGVTWHFNPPGSPHFWWIVGSWGEIGQIPPQTCDW